MGYGQGRQPTRCAHRRAVRRSQATALATVLSVMPRRVAITRRPTKLWKMLGFHCDPLVDRQLGGLDIPRSCRGIAMGSEASENLLSFHEGWLHSTVVKRRAPADIIAKSVHAENRR